MSRKWVNTRQNCLSLHIHTAKAHSESTRPELPTFGKWARKELQRLVKMANAPPTVGEWRAFYARLCRLIALYGSYFKEQHPYLDWITRLA